MSDGVMSVSADATLLDAAKLLANCRVSALPVVRSYPMRENMPTLPTFVATVPSMT